jgi:D-3-phosphoglycerate dehydrogenase / 2-oxoglutarate reductase
LAGFRVVVTDQVFPDVEIERELIETAGGTLDIAQGSRDEVLAQARTADALLNTYLAMDAAAIRGLERCRIIARYGIGVDNVDLDAAKAAGLAVTNVPDYCVEEVATHTVAYILSLVRRLPQGDALVRGGGWGASGLGEVHRVSALTLGLLGYGKIARNVAGIMSAMGMRILAHDPYVHEDAIAQMTGLDELFAASDVLSVHCPLTPQTKGLVNSRTLALMRPSAIVINTSRGPVVNVNDLVAALREGTIAAAGLDVFESEPPAIDRLLTGVPNLLVTPHAAFYSAEAIKESQRKAATQVLKLLAGEPLDYRVA